MKVRPRKGRNPWTEKRLRQIAEEQAKEPKPKPKKKTLASERWKEWRSNLNQYKDRYGTYSKFKENFDANYEEALSYGATKRRALKAGITAVRNSVKTPEQLAQDKYRSLFKGIGRVFQEFRRSQGNLGSGRFAFSGMTYLRREKIGGVSYMVYSINEDWEYWVPDSPQGDDTSFFQYVGNTARDGSERAEEKVNEEKVQEVFKEDQPMEDDDLQKEIEDTFIFNKETEGTSVKAGGGSLPPIIPPSNRNSTATLPPSGPLSVRKMTQEEEKTIDLPMDNPLGLLAAVKPIKKRKRRKK